MSSRTEKFQRKPRDPSQPQEKKSDEKVKASNPEASAPVRAPVPTPTANRQPPTEEEPEKEEEQQLRFPPDEEASLLQESHAQKAKANALFSSSSFQEAISAYELALSTCPNYLSYEIAVLKSNIAACYLKLEDWKRAVDMASAALDKLDELRNKDGDEKEEIGEEEEEADEEIISQGAEKAEKVENLCTSPRVQRDADIKRIRTKALLRRARARSEMGGWSTLQGAEEDYKTLSQMNNLSPADRKLVQQQLLSLTPRIKTAQEKEVGDMMGKLKELGNGILKPFGLSTDNFQMVKDENTGGYSMNFNQGGSSS